MSTTGISRTPFVRIPRLPSTYASWVAEPLSGPDQPGFLGSGARVRLAPVRALPAAIARTEVFYPDPCDPDTSCREPVTETAGDAALSVHETRTLYEPTRRGRLRGTRPGDPTCAGPSGRAASCDPPRRGARLAEPKVSSIVGYPLEVWNPPGEPDWTHEPREVGRFSTGCSQPVDISPAPFRPLPLAYALTKRTPGKGLGPLVFCSGPKA